MTWNDLVRKYFPDATDAEADYILWNDTAFPFAAADYVETQLRTLQTEFKDVETMRRMCRLP